MLEALHHAPVGDIGEGVIDAREPLGIDLPRLQHRVLRKDIRHDCLGRSGDGMRGHPGHADGESSQK